MRSTTSSHACISASGEYLVQARSEKVHDYANPLRKSFCCLCLRERSYDRYLDLRRGERRQVRVLKLVSLTLMLAAIIQRLFRMFKREDVLQTGA